MKGLYTCKYFMCSFSDYDNLEEMLRITYLLLSYREQGQKLAKQLEMALETWNL